MTSLSKSLWLAAALSCTLSGAQAELIVNGGFEVTSDSTSTPTGWFNIGHSDGVIGYEAFGTPAYEGANFYDLGGYGDASGPIGDGIAQTFATTVGTSYTVSFGLSAENSSGDETLTVSADYASFDYLLSVGDQGAFRRAFATQSFDFIATSESTTLSFIHSAGPGGANDPLIDGVNVVVTAPVPEPETYALMSVGLAALALAAKRRRRI